MKFVLAAFVLLLVTACGGEGPSSPAETVTVMGPTETMTAGPAVGPTDSSKRMLAVEADALGGDAAQLSESDLVEVGVDVCNSMADGSSVEDAVDEYEVAHQELVRQLFPFLVVRICPEHLDRISLVDLARGIEVPEPESTQPPEPTGPATSFSDGTYQVGTDIAAGTYRGGSADCFIYASSSAGDLGSLLRSNSGVKVAIELNDGEWVRASDCGTLNRG